jgi:peptidoglycan/LPS O-acetylase OafA/YrhL
VIALVSAPLVLRTATLPIDRIGARCLVFFAGAALLLAGRSYRHRAARAQLRAAGLCCWAALAVALLPLLGDDAVRWVAVGSVGTAVLLVVVAVAVGRGWRSAWWSRRAEVAEGLAGAGAIGALVVASGLFRALWEIKFRV